MTARLGVLISGRGSNLQSIIDAVGRGMLDASIALVISNKPDAGGLQRAQAAGIPTDCLRPKAFASRDAYDAELAKRLMSHGVNLVCLAGYMRLVGKPLLDAFPNAILNIHPSLLPSFPGLDAQRQALEHGVRVSGATVHFVTEGLDEGPIVLQAAVPVLHGDSVDTLSARILTKEHEIYPKAIATVLAGGWRLDGRRFITPNA